MKVCFIGGCGHAREAYRRWAGRPDVQLCGFARWSAHEQPITAKECIYLTKVALLAREAADTGRRIEIKE